MIAIATPVFPFFFQDFRRKEGVRCVYDLHIRFQEIVDVLAGNTLGFEATLVGAIDLFNRAVKNGDVTVLDRQARVAALRAGRRLLDAFQRLGKSQRLFLNLAPQTMTERGWLPEQAPYAQIVLEITESVSTPVDENILAEMNRLQSLGVQFAIDDFGAGFSHLDLLTRLPVTYVKLDKRFAQTVQDNRTGEIIKHYVWMMQDLRIALIAEGVETREQKERLLDLGVRYMQGFYFGYPRSVEAILRQHNIVPEGGRAHTQP